jgi:hypothetical protein
MRSIVLMALAGAILGQLTVAASAADIQDTSGGKPATSLKHIFVPSEGMLRRDPTLTSVTPGVENRGSQLVDPARLGGAANSGAAVGPHDQATATAAAERAATTSASRMGPSEAAATITNGSTADTQSQH